MGNKNTVLIAFICVAWIANEAQAEKHVVGGSQGWDTSPDLASWGSSKTFKVGDQLVFKYSSGLHSVTELPDESAYQTCDIGVALDSKTTGKDVVKLNKAGTRYFACGTFGHCDQGMKVKIEVVNAPSSRASPSTTTSTTFSTSKASNFSHSFATIFVVVASFFFFFFLPHFGFDHILMFLS